MSKKIAFLGAGILFGFALSRVGASDYDLIYHMFSGQNLKLAYVMITAIIVGAIGMKLLTFLGNRGYKGVKITVNKKKLTLYTAIGGIVFGVGWAISGSCPGTVLAQIGEGKLLGLFTFLGLVAGTYIYALLAEKNHSLH